MSFMLNVLLSRNFSVCKKVVLCGFNFSHGNGLVRLVLHGTRRTRRSLATTVYNNKGGKMNNGAVPNEERSNEAAGEDCAVPNEKWSKEAVELFNKLSEMTGDWKKSHSYTSKAADGSRLFGRAVTGEPGKFFEYAFFNNPTLQCSKGVVQFGLYTRGPVGHVHGGATATILDIAMGNLIYNCGINSVTGNLNVVYVRPLPLDTTTLVEAKIDKIEGRKIFASAEIKTVDGCDIYSKVTSIFIMLKSWKSSL